MWKSGLVGGARPTQGRRPVQLPDAVEGQIAEICRDLAVEAKRIRQLQQQADELRTVIRQWVGQFQPDAKRKRANRAERR